MGLVAVYVGGKLVGTVQGMAVLGSRIRWSGMSAGVEALLMETQEVDIEAVDRRTGKRTTARRAFLVSLDSSRGSATLETNGIEEEDEDTAA